MATALSALALGACGGDDDADLSSIFGGQDSGDESTGDGEWPSDPPDNLAELSEEDLARLAEQGLEGLTDQERAEIERILEETPELSDFLDESELPDLSAGTEYGDDSSGQDQPGSDGAGGTDGTDDHSGILNRPEIICDVISAGEMSNVLGYEVTTDLIPTFPGSDCLFDVDGQEAALVHVEWGPGPNDPWAKDPATYLDERSAYMWDGGTYAIDGLGDAAKYGPISDGAYTGIAIAEQRSDSVVLLTMWMYGAPDQAMVDRGAEIANLVLPRV